MIAIVRNALSTVVLPEMVRRGRDNPEVQLALWKRATAMNAVLLLPVIVLVIRYADTAVTTVFGHSYEAAAPLMQIFMISIFRECFDFAPALRAMNKVSPLVYSNLVALVACAIGMLVLTPRFGVNGAMAAAVLSTYVDLIWQAAQCGPKSRQVECGAHPLVEHGAHRRGGRGGRRRDSERDLDRHLRLRGRGRLLVVPTWWRTLCC